MTTLPANNGQSGDFEEKTIVPKGLYELKLERISEPRQSTMPAQVDPKTGKTREPKPYVFIEYRVLGGKHDQALISEIASWTLGMGTDGPSHLRLVMEGCYGRELEDKELCDPHAVADQQPQFRALVETRTKQDNSQANKITGVIETTKPYARTAEAVLADVPF